MKNILFVLLALTLSSSVFASGSFECQTTDKKVAISGGVSSAGTWVKSVSINGKELVLEKDFTAQQVYLGANSFNFLIMDKDYNKHLLRVETVRYGDMAAGMAIMGDHDEQMESKVIVCEFLY